MRKILVGFWAAITGISQAVVPVAALTAGEVISEFILGAGEETCPTEEITGVLCVLAKTILVLLRFSGGIAVLFLIYGGIQYIVSGGDKIALTTAKHTITYAVLGLIVILGAVVIIKTAEALL